MDTQHTLFEWDKLLAGSSTGYMVFLSPGKNKNPDKANTCVFANQASETLTGFSPAVDFTYSGIFGKEYQGTQKARNTFFSHSGKSCQVTESMLSDELVMVSITEIHDPPFANLMPAYSNLLWKEAEKTMQFGGWIWNPDNSKVEWSEGMFRLMGYDSGELKEQRLNIGFWLQHVHPEDQASFKRQIEAIPTYLDSYILEFRAIDSQGEEKSLYLKGENVPGKKPGSIVAIGTAFDISVLKQMQEQLESKVNDLNKSNADLEQFAYVASHDLQEPLRKIASFGERLGIKASENLDEEQSLYLDRILNATRRMQEMVKNLLEFSKIAGTPRVFAATDLNTILQNALGDLELVILKKHAVIEFGNLPVIQAIPSQMAQLFVNLISNSLKFTKEGIVPRISVTSVLVPSDELDQRERIKLVFQDNGIGFGSESAERIFTIFQRLRGRSEYEGSGIGLSVCKKVVEMHEGSIEAFGEPDSGARFEIILPLSQEH